MRSRGIAEQVGFWSEPSDSELVIEEHDDLRLVVDDESLSDLDECRWDPSVALDPRHRPQTFGRPATTVRREWCRYPQEAHLLDLEGHRYRRLTPDEMAILQGFDPSWFDVPDVTWRNKVRAIGDAVPPPLAKAVVGGVRAVRPFELKTSIEVCAGAGGLASGAAQAGLRHELLLDQWEPSWHILRHKKPWRASKVDRHDVRSFDFLRFRGKIGLLSGGPPCQPWSWAGRKAATRDPRDLLGSIHEVVAAVQPEAFIFENVLGLVQLENRGYLDALLQRLRNPPDGPRYGVVAGILNAADFGVPQIRRRLFLIGIRDAPSAAAYRAFEAIQGSATHRNRLYGDERRVRWVTVGEALSSRADPGGWRRWVTLETESQTDH